MELHPIAPGGTLPPHQIALATCEPLPVEADESAIEAALVAAGVAFEWAVWDDPTVDWARFAGVVIRTTWDYHPQVGAFLAWARQVEAVTRLWNPVAVLEWNCHKGYLGELASDGVVVVPTVTLARGEHGTSLRAVAEARGWTGQVVVKPAVSVGALGASLGAFDDPAMGTALDTLLEGGDALVQPFLDEVRDTGETSTVFIDGEVTHALRKVPAPGDYRSQPEWGGRLEGITPRRDCVALGRAAIAAAQRRTGAPILYARVDTIDVGGAPHLIELEVIEPDLFFGLGPPGAAASFADALRHTQSGA